jgi:hypothetical protein
MWIVETIVAAVVHLQWQGPGVSKYIGNWTTLVLLGLLGLKCIVFI